ncbi:MAG: aminotransferase class V-fold PLP-dependent enzyme [Candidatus Hydrogenedentes bacterium]|nr:aminotransferase class V-fold PLP-dependent enzyme [Candidatus Hydrogenedentota bacterium]
MKADRNRQKLALQGGLKAVGAMEGKGKPKIGAEEFLSVAARFGLSKKSLSQIRKIVAKEEWGVGPYFANYYSDLKETMVQAYEREARKLFGTKFAIGVSSGTGALHCAFVAAGVGPGKEVICSAIGFFATAAAVVISKGVPVFCDVDESLHMDPAKIEALITDRTVAIAVTHVMGGVANMPAIMAIARKHKLMVIEDCAQSCAASIKGRYAGTYGDIGCFSISAYKIVGGGEGGLIIMNDQRLWDRAQGMAEGGGLWRPDRFGPPRYEGELFCGTNYRMSELEAAVDVVQIRKSTAVVKRFNAVKQRVCGRLKTYREITPQKSNDVNGEVGYMLRFFPETIELGERIVTALRAEGVNCGMRGKNAPPDWHVYHDMMPLKSKAGATTPDCSFYCRQYTERGGKVRFDRGTCPVADDLFDRVITVGLNQWMSARDCQNMALGINKVLSAYCAEDQKGAAWC